MTARGARRLAHGLWVTTAVLWVAAMILVLAGSPADIAPIALLALPMATYASVGALVARRDPENPIGWLFASVGIALAVWMFGLAYARIGQAAGADIGDLPGAAVVAWVGVLSLIALLPATLPVFLLYFPDGRLRSRRWRPVLWAAILGGVLMAVGATAHRWDFDPVALEPLAWPAGLPGIGGVYGAGLVVVLTSAFAGLLALIMRFREAGAEQRQPLRLLVGMLIAMAVATALAVVVPLATGSADWSWIFIALAILIDGFGVFVGIPLATAAAVLTFGLYDVGIVVKKTVVYVLLVVIFLALLGIISLMLSPLPFIASGETSGTPEQTAARLVTGGALFLAILTIGFRPAKRLARRLVYGKRSTPYEAMSEFAERLGEAYSTQDVLPRMAAIVRASTGAQVARVWLHVGNELRPVASAPPTATEVSSMPIAGDDAPDGDGLRVFPVRDRGELLGALTVAMPPAEPLTKTGERLVADLAGQAGLVLQNVRLVRDLQESRRRIVTAQDERARKLERDLHDGAQQQLVALAVKLRLAQGLVTKDPAKAEAMLGDLQAEAQSALEDLRDLARGIYPPLLADKGLGAALEAQARRAPVPVAVESDDIGRYPQAVESAVYFCTLEALNNVAKYANASRVTILLSDDDGRLVFSVADDGGGFDPGATGRGTGLQGMADRLDALGGALEVASAPGAGTTVTGSVPAVGEAHP